MVTVSSVIVIYNIVNAGSLDEGQFDDQKNSDQANARAKVPTPWMGFDFFSLQI